MPINYLGAEKLKKDVSKLLQNATKKSNYDCIVGFSGGRDSTYLLWYVVNVLKLKPLAVFSNSMLIPQQTLSNIQKTTTLLGVDLLIKEHNYLKICSKHYLNSWAKYPSPATLITLCTGCRLGFSEILYKETIKRKIPFYFTGGTPFEKGYFKKNLISNKHDHFSFPIGYIKQVIKNPSLISSIRCLMMLIKEYYLMPKYLSNAKDKPVRISPFYKYLRWEKEKIEKTIKNELEWERYPGLASSYRGDCEIGVIRQFLYNKFLGYNDKDDHLSCLIRDNQISREEALRQTEIEKNIKPEILMKAFKKLGFNFNDYITQIEINARKHDILYK